MPLPSYYVYDLPANLTGLELYDGVTSDASPRCITSPGVAISNVVS